MFKNKSSANEIFNNFKINTINSQQENVEINRFNSTLDKLSLAASNLEKAGLIKQAEAIDIILHSLAKKVSKKEIKNPKSSKEMVKNLLETGTAFKYNADDDLLINDEEFEDE